MPLTPQLPSLTIFFPAYNDWGTIPSLVVLSDLVARELTDDFEIIVVNDCSPDHLQLLLDDLVQHYPRLKVVRHETNRGYGGALRSGFANASKDWVFYTDGDAQYDVRELKLLWENRGDADMVNGWKIARSDPWYRILIGRLYHHFVRFMFGLKIKDVDCDFRLIKRSVFEKIELLRNSGLICVELVTKIEKNGLRVNQVPVHHSHRAYGRSQFFNFRRVFRVLYEMGFLWRDLILRKEVTKPRR